MYVTNIHSSLFDFNDIIGAESNIQKMTEAKVTELLATLESGNSVFKIRGINGLFSLNRESNTFCPIIYT